MGSSRAALMAGHMPKTTPTKPENPKARMMAQTGISTGYNDGTFRPSADVTRQAMAAFMRRLADL